MSQSMIKQFVIPLFLLVTNFSIAEEIETICVDYCGPVCDDDAVHIINDSNKADKLGIKVYLREHEQQCNGVGFSFPNTLGEHEVQWGELHIGSKNNLKFKSYLDIDEDDPESVNGFCISKELLSESSVFIQYGDAYYTWSNCGTKLYFKLDPLLNGS
jgi:hypothetical protein